jgi:hypothetical protein
MTALGTRLLELSVGGSDFTAEISDCRITSQPADNAFVTFEDAASGGKREYRLKFKAVQDPAVGTLWDKVWTGAGTSVAAIIKPAGGEAASALTPHFTGNVTITEPDGDLLGGEADASTTARFTFEAEWVFAAKPLRVIA